MNLKRLLSAALLVGALSSTDLDAATVGSLDGYRLYGDAILGGDYSGMVAGLQSQGHDFASAARDLTPAYLDSIDVFMHGRAGAPVSRTYPQGSEVPDLRQWVSDGGIYVQFGGNGNYATDLNRWSGLFGFNYISQFYSGGNWTGIAHPFLAGVAPSSLLGASSSSYLTWNMAHRDLNNQPLSIDVFATVAGRGAVLGAQYGQGYVVFFSDENPVWGSTPNASAMTFLNNVLNSVVAPVPLPASLPMLVMAFGALAALRRRAVSG
ncbi:VPLPA-CTERM sorting domain-containing protein [Tropicibacter sp. S64]|uniref:VPLPA-CTERM sorting domain-containing protein n=1 Tax=Tropicibacter sp. S64 TaxID=3415122 RepID=UPI003C7C689D